MDRLRALRGCVGTVVLGQIDPDFAAAREELRAFNITHGFTNVEYVTQAAALVEQGRDALCAHALEQKYDYLLQIDADAVFAPDALVRILNDAFVLVQDSDAVGAYCQLKGSHICSLDSGTGTWEPHFPGEGLVPAIRTGAHFLLTKTSALRKFGPPWFRSRLAKRPLDALAEVDNYARIKLHGDNPFAGSDSWQQLVGLAKSESSSAPSGVGEDSGFCDALLAAGGRLYVDTDLVAGHVEKRVIQPSDLKHKLDEQARKVALACGVLP